MKHKSASGVGAPLLTCSPFMLSTAEASTILSLTLQVSTMVCLYCSRCCCARCCSVSTGEDTPEDGAEPGWPPPPGAAASTAGRPTEAAEGVTAAKGEEAADEAIVGQVGDEGDGQHVFALRPISVVCCQKNLASRFCFCLAAEAAQSCSKEFLQPL